MDTDTKYETQFAPTDGPYDYHWKGDKDGGKLHPGLGAESPALKAALQSDPEAAVLLEETLTQVAAKEAALDAERARFEAEKAAFEAGQKPKSHKKKEG